MINKIREELKETFKANPVATIRLTLVGYDETIRNCFESVVTELERLKTLDDNVKRAIKDLDDALACEMAACPETEQMHNLKILLESLYKKQD
jgi:ferritin-like protein